MSYSPSNYKQLGSMNNLNNMAGCGGCGVRAPQVSCAPALQIVPVYGGMGYGALQHYSKGDCGCEGGYFGVQQAYPGNAYGGVCASGNCIQGCYGVKDCNNNANQSVNPKSVHLAYY